MTAYFKRFTIDKDGITIIDFDENKVFECKYSNEAKSLCNILNDLDEEKSNLEEENEKLKQTIKEIINTFYNSGLDYILSEIEEEK